tara:strand:- start:669 stop:827 length:159 start_codon:yes stop_codon:yes gene_type:complete
MEFKSLIKSKIQITMGRTAGTPNKIIAEVKSKLENLIDGLINSIRTEELNNT